ncbi:WecB/TagA/CpsF family glycosyltransferase [Blastochloris sulfoviridis]|uniref:WecB/TagA/CpsF family glycosyltransferase n=1 Tax=Blastochloris sulfoviridis TaxID=50712 RepID=A0A5M6I631_9HYPH|nr:WecB/TagA/CpsF family glycosyltransferase [Blastochloris sulfoviridis]KAA5603674.1 WecB/TagA/CpsF family glycosyltransferase [Blastochloris sulfoviridis]
MSAIDVATREAVDRGTLRVLGVPVSLVDMAGAVDTVTGWGRSGPAKTVFVRDVHGLMLALQNPALLALHERASLVVPDGMPLTWVGRLRGFGSRIGRVPGADLMAEVCRASAGTGLRHFFFGGKPGVAETLVERLTQTYPGLQIAGTFSPPMRSIEADAPLSPEEAREIEIIRQAAPDIIWVGLSTPKQEYWMMKAAPHLPHGVLLGVGAAFDFHSGLVRRAPPWMRDNGLEWLHRLASEPRRLWRRYLVLAPLFVVKVIEEQISGRWKAP